MWFIWLCEYIMSILKIFKSDISNNIFTSDKDRLVFLKAMSTGLKFRSITTGQTISKNFDMLLQLHDQSLERNSDGYNNSYVGHWRLIKRDCGIFKCGDLVWVSAKHDLAFYLSSINCHIHSYTYPVSIEDETSFLKNRVHSTYQFENRNLKLIANETKFKCDKLYICAFYNSSEFFIKVGITGSKNVMTRFSGISKNGGYKVLPLFVAVHTPSAIHQREFEIQQLLTNYRYTPLNASFSGSGECFTSINEDFLRLLGSYEFMDILEDHLDSFPLLVKLHKDISQQEIAA